MFDEDGLDVHRFNKLGIHSVTQKKVDPQGFYSNGVHSITNTNLDAADGFNIKGFNVDGFDRNGCTATGDWMMSMAPKIK